MIAHRIIGSLVAAISFVMFGLIMLSRESSAMGVEIMDRLWMPFVLLFIVAQVVLCVIFLKPMDRLVPLLLFAGGTAVYVFLNRGGAGAAIPLHQALMAGASFSGLTTGALVMMGDK